MTRLGFAVDIVGYSKRPVPAQANAQRRLRALVDGILAELRVRRTTAAVQFAGDGATVFLPMDVDFTWAFPRLVHSMRDLLSRDNRAHSDRLRMRASVAIGPVRSAAAGYTERTVVELHRLLESPILRRAVAENSAAELVLLVADQLYRDVVGVGHPGLEVDEFQRVTAETKGFVQPAWLWLSH